MRKSLLRDNLDKHLLKLHLQMSHPPTERIEQEIKKAEQWKPQMKRSDKRSTNSAQVHCVEVGRKHNSQERLHSKITAS